jgi:hypothetical protein
VGYTSRSLYQPSRTCFDECTGVLLCAGVCAILASQDRTVKTSTSHATPRPVSMTGSAWRWMPWATSVNAPQVSVCNHQHFHDHSDCECVVKSQYLGRSPYTITLTCLMNCCQPAPSFFLYPISLVVFFSYKVFTWTHDREDSSIHPCVSSLGLLITFWSNLILIHTGHMLISVNFLRNSWLYQKCTWIVL